MNRVIFLPLVLLATLTLALFFQPGVPSAQAQEPLEMQSEATYTFGQTMRFMLRAKTPDPVSQAALFFTTPQLDSTFVVELNLAPSRAISLTHEVPLSQVQLSPFTTVTYWWRLETGNEAYGVPAATLYYADDRFTWQELAGPHAIVHWTGEEVELGQIALDVIARAWPRLSAVIPVAAGEPLHIYIYPGSAERRSALLLTGRDWVGASADPESGVALVTAVNPRTAALDLGRSIPHELTHLLLYRATGPGYENVPRWFEEGLATLMEATRPPDQEQLVRDAIASLEAMPLSELCRTFPATEAHSGLAYAQSASVVGYIQTEYGNHALTEMIRAYADGADCDSGVRRVLDISLAELEDQWRDAKRPLSPLETLWQRGGLWIALLGGGFVLMTLLLLPLRKQP
jgi:hypothetical protein